VDVPEQPPVVAEFVIAAGAWPDAPLWDGMMTISGVPADATVTYRGKPLVPPGPIEMALDPRVGFVEVRRQGRLWDYLIRVEAPFGDAGFWQRLPDEKQVDRPDWSLEQFLADVRLAASRRDKSGKTGLTGTSGDDQFNIPAEQLLVRLARHRRSLARLPAITISRALPRLLRSEPTEALAVASAIKAAYHLEQGSGSDTLLKALTSSIASFDALGGDDGPKQN
jgi:hypothetical protein